MQYHLTTEPNYSVADITKADERTAKALISVDIHEENSVAFQSTGLVYPDVVLSGAGKLTRDEFLHKVNLLGASINVSVSQGQVHFTLRSTAENFPKLTKLFITMIQSPSFSAYELKRAKTVTKNDLHQSRDDSKSLAHDGLRNAIYGQADRRYTFAIDSLITGVLDVDKKSLQSFHTAILNNHWHVSVAGNKKVVEDMQKTTKMLKSAQPNTKKAPKHLLKPAKKQLHLQNVEGRQNIDFSIGVPVPITIHHPDFLPLSFGIAVLAKWGGFAGRLMSTVREKEGLTYGIYGKLEDFQGSEQGYFRIMSFFAPEKSSLALTSTFREINKLYKSGITQKEFEAFHVILDTQQQLLSDSLGRLLVDLHTYHSHGFDLDEMRQHKARLKDVSRRQVNDAIKKYLDPSNMYVSGAGPITDVQKDLEKWMKSMS